MAQWGQNDSAVTANSTTTKETSTGAPIGTYVHARAGGRGATPTSMAANADFGNTSPGAKAGVDYNMFGNVTMGAFIANQAVGVFLVNATTMTAPGGATNLGGNVEIGYVTYVGSGYAANAAVTVTAVNGGTGATVNSTAAVGRITTLTVNSAGSGYITAPSISIAAPAAISISANTTSFEPTGANAQFSANTTGIISNTFLTIATANTIFPTVGQKVFYYAPAGNSVVTPLANATYYWIAFSNTTVVSLAQSYAAAIANTPVNTLATPATSNYNELANTYDVINVTTANSLFLVNDQLTYVVPTGNTPVSPLTGNTVYYVSFSNSSTLALSATLGGANISFAPTVTGTQTHSLQGATATGYVDVNSVLPQVTHSGWILRKEGQGGRAGRIQYETLVAGGSYGQSGTTATGVYGTATITSNSTVDPLV